MNTKHCNIDHCKGCGDLHVSVPSDYGMSKLLVLYLQDDEDCHTKFDVDEMYYPNEVQLMNDFTSDICCGCDTNIKKCICHKLGK
jgi:hypothetical protein